MRRRDLGNVIKKMGSILTIVGRLATAAFVAVTAKDLYQRFFAAPSAESAAIEKALSAAKAAGLDDDELLKIAAGTRYDQVEQAGGSPDDFWRGLSPAQQEAIRFSPESLRRSMDRTSFLGLTSAVLFVAAFGAGLIGAARGIPIIYSTIAKLAAARAAGATALDLTVILEEAKALGIAKVWIPGLIAGIATAGGWLTSSQTNNLNDVDLWGRINLQQAAGDYAKAQARLRAGATGAGGFGDRTYPLTRITMATTAKPVVVIGTLFSSVVKRTDAFDRVPDDAITSASDLQADAQVNLNKWLASLPGRLLYNISIQSNPFDEHGNRQTGSWITLGIAIRSVAGKVTPLDTILLGPIDPVVYMPRSQEISTVQIELPKLLTAQELAEVRLPAGGLKTIGVDGTVIPVVLPESMPAAFAPPTSPVAVAAAAQAAAAGRATATIAATPGGFAPSGVIIPGLVSAEDYRERGLAVPPGVPARAFVEAQAAATAELPPLGGPRGFRKGQVLAIVGTEACTNIREGAQITRRILSCLPNGTRVIADGWGGESDGFDWYRVRAGNITGFVAGSHLVRTS